jgi:pilus assembly protein Flp/PilA
MMNTLVHLMFCLRNDRRGVTALEYGLIASLIAVVVIAAVTAVGTGASATFTTVGNSL